MTTYAITPTVASFADAVRDALADLPTEEVDELTEGLEADLAEAFADGTGELPDPVAYAEELRTAAGMPRREPAALPSVFRSVAVGVRRAGHDTARLMRSSAVTSTALELVVGLRPVWWVARAVVAYFAAAWLVDNSQEVMPHSAVQWLVLTAAVVVSAAWGLGRWRPSWFRIPLVVGNVLALLLLVPMLKYHNDQTTTWAQAEHVYGSQRVVSVEPDLTGVYSDGEPVTNVFAFDAKGRPLRDVQLFGQDGKPLQTSTPGGNGCIDPQCTENGLWAPSILRTGKYAWNVYPMSMLPSDDNLAFLHKRPEARPAPFVKVEPVDRERSAQANSPYADGPAGTD